MDGLTALQAFTVLLLVHGTSGQTVTVSGPSRAAAATNVPLTCTVDGGTATSLNWIDDSTSPTQTIYQGSDRFSADDKYLNFKVTSPSSTQSVMTIENAEVEDDGVYRCEIPTHSNTKDLVIEAASNVTLTLTSIVTDNVDMFVAACDAAGGKPQETITWTFDGVTQTDGNGNTIVETNPPATAPLSTTKSVFTFPATLENYRQTLVCQVSGHDVLTELNGQESEDLNIHTSPSAEGTTVTVDYATQGTSITVSCNAQNQPSPAMRNYYIFSNGTLIHESMEVDNEVTVSDPEEGTQYTCMAGNYLGNTTLSEALTYEPSRPTTPPPTIGPTTPPPTIGPTTPPPTIGTTTRPTESNSELFTTGRTTTELEEEPTPCTCVPTGLGSGASAGIAVLVILLVASVIINIIQFIMLKRQETRPGFEESHKNVSRERRNVSHEANDNTTYEMIQNGDRAYTALKAGSSHSPIIAPENVTFLTRLGSIGRGDFGGVWKGVLCSNQSQLDVAIRQIPDQVTKSINVLQAVKVLSELPDQPNVVKCLGYCQEQGSILYEFISGGTLLTHLQTTGVQSQPTYGNLKPNGVRLDEGSLLNLAWQIAKGMQFIASKKIIHGNLCAHNVVLADRKQCKLSDYGLASSLFSDKVTPTRWSSPETMVNGDQSTEGDSWSFGIVLWEIVTLGARPYPKMTFDTVQKEVANGYQMPRPRHCGQEVYKVMSGCWEKEAINRSNFDQIVESLERILAKTHNYLSLNDLDEGLYASKLDM